MQKQKKISMNRDFVEAYSLNDPEQAEMLALVVSAEHTKEQLLEERKLITCRELHANTMPVLVVVTHSTKRTGPKGRRKLLVRIFCLPTPTLLLSCTHECRSITK